jgi:hypothetical protein
LPCKLVAGVNAYVLLAAMVLMRLVFAIRRSGRRARVLSAGRPEAIFSMDASDGPANA